MQGSNAPPLPSFLFMKSERHSGVRLTNHNYQEVHNGIAIRGNRKVTQGGDQRNFFSVFVTFRYLCEVPRNKTKEGSRSALFWDNITFVEILSSFVSLILFERFTSGGEEQRDACACR